MDRENMFINEDNISTMSSFRHNELHGTNGASEQVQKCLFTPIWDHSVDQNDPFESALSSMVSSPATSNAPPPPPPPGICTNDSIVLRELIGRLGSIYNSGEVSPQSYMNGSNSTNTSCYNTPMNSPPKLNSAMMDHQIRGNLQNIQFCGNHFPAQSSLSQITTDPGFAQRAARYSCFADKNLGGLTGHQFLGLDDSELQQRMENQMDYSGKLSRVSNNISLVKDFGSQMNNGQENNDFDQKFSMLSRSSTPKPEFNDTPQNSSVSDQNLGGGIDLSSQNDMNSRQRKNYSKRKGKDSSAKEANDDAENSELSQKKSKSCEKERSMGEENGTNNSGGNKKEDEKSTEAPKDYIHVRARRGQATDAHSLAERVRREKISQKMKLLQDLVPGCNKISGKAVMLDEIINYVQSLQCQVEFLSMKLATIDPRVDVNLEGLLPKEMFQSCESMPNSTFALNNLETTYPFQFQSQQVPNLHNAAEVSKENASQAATFFEDDLQSMFFGLNQAHNFQGVMLTGEMKVEI